MQALVKCVVLKECFVVLVLTLGVGMGVAWARPGRSLTGDLPCTEKGKDCFTQCSEEFKNCLKKQFKNWEQRCSKQLKDCRSTCLDKEKQACLGPSKVERTDYGFP